MPDEKKRPLEFRKDALEELSTPDRLDQLVSIVGPRDWLVLATLGLLAALTIGWGFLGRLPTTVTGRSVLIRPRSMVPIQATTAGRLTALHLRVGDHVRKGDLLAVIDVADLRAQRESAARQAADLAAQHREKSVIERERTRLNEQDIRAQRQLLELQRQNREASLRNAETLSVIIERRLAGQRALEGQGLISKLDDGLLNAENARIENDGTIKQLRAELRQIEAQIEQLAVRAREISLAALESSTARNNEIERLTGTLAVLDAQIARDGRILSEREGRVIETSVSAGEVVPDGGRLGVVLFDDEASPLRCQAYFAVADGKRIRPGMRVLVTPDAVKRERFGGISGTVRSVSPFPVTREGTAAVLGSTEVASWVLAAGPSLEVLIDLQTDRTTPSGFRWTSSRGPDLQISSGTTASSRATVEERAPITYLMPFLRYLSGAY
ncbi:MAG: NHLP bacteriocin system secretion protein [Acidobacteria bacterium]|nr:NHLP bacteriocin system secretion protein [Acidobacteriota bacterium]